MARWRPVDTRLWNDAKFKTLSDDARLVWAFLLTCPSSVIPGVIVSGQAGLAEMIGWPVERFAKGYRELLPKGLPVHADWGARLVWLENGLKYQPPQNPNQITGWSTMWDEVPECSLKLDIWRSLKSYCERWPEPFAKGFAEPLPIGLQKGYRNQEQEQEQYQEQEHPEGSGAIAPPPTAPQAKKPKRPVHDLPADWAPNASHQALAREKRLDVTHQAAMFRDHAAAKARQCANWDAAFSMWLRKATEYRGSGAAVLPFNPQRVSRKL